jgi:hypothetical protein
VFKMDAIATLMQSGGLPVIRGSAVLGCDRLCCSKINKTCNNRPRSNTCVISLSRLSENYQGRLVPVQNQTTSFLQTSSQRMMDVVNNTAHEINQYSLTAGSHLPLIAGISFLPGFIFGISRG